MGREDRRIGFGFGNGFGQFMQLLARQLAGIFLRLDRDGFQWRGGLVVPDHVDKIVFDCNETTAVFLQSLAQRFGFADRVEPGIEPNGELLVDIAQPHRRWRIDETFDREDFRSVCSAACNV